MLNYKCPPDVFLGFVKLLLILNIFTLACCSESTDPVTSSHVTECPYGWIRYENEKCFKVMTNLLNQEEAEGNCKTLGSNLASIHSDRERKFVADMVLKEAEYAKLTQTWIGGKRFPNDHWLWFDLSDFQYTHLHPSHDLRESGQSCLALATAKSEIESYSRNFGLMFNINCDELYFSICQKTLLEPICRLEATYPCPQESSSSDQTVKIQK